MTVPVFLQDDPNDDYAYFAVYDTTGKVVQMGGCPRSDLALQGQNFPDGFSVMEVEQGQDQPMRYRVDLSGDKPRLTMIEGRDGRTITRIGVQSRSLAAPPRLI